MCWWKLEAEMVPDTECRIYLAELTGPHPVYRFARDFLPLDFVYNGKKVTTDFGLDEGVYEESITYRDLQTRIAKSRHRRWFCVYDGEVFDLLGYDEVEKALLGFEMKRFCLEHGVEMSLPLSLYFGEIAEHTWLRERVAAFDVLVTPDLDECEPSA